MSNFVGIYSLNLSTTSYDSRAQKFTLSRIQNERSLFISSEEEYTSDETQLPWNSDTWVMAYESLLNWLRFEAETTM